MSQTVAFHKPKELYEALRTQAAKKGRTPDALVVEWLAEAIRATNRIEADPRDDLEEAAAPSKPLLTARLSPFEHTSNGISARWRL